MKKTLVLGASPNPSRYAYTAVRRLKANGHEVIPLGIRDGEIDGIKILNGQPDLQDVHTVTVYLNPVRQAEYYGYLLNLRPKRIIFNPGAENPELMQLAKKEGIEVQTACTLVLLSIDDF
jgi:predicted CoA-binding protein